jgi:pimeloyl-ACP methyl ester carboxylesterase
VVVFDPRGNGRSERPAGPDAYGEREYVEDMLAVMEATDTERVVAVSLSLGAERSLLFADAHPERVLGLAFIGPAVPLVPDLPTRGRYLPFFEQELETDEGWARYNAHYWRRDYRGFVEFFISQIFTEPHSTKQIEDAVGWGLETDAETLIATARAEGLDEPTTREIAERIECPVLVIHGEDDAIRPIAGAEELAALTGARFIRMPGVGHCPQARKPVAVNLALREFVETAVRAPPVLATGNPRKED